MTEPAILATANLRQVDGEWEAVAYADKTYRVTAPTEDEAKAAFVQYFYEEYEKATPGAFAEPLTVDQVHWTRN